MNKEIFCGFLSLLFLFRKVKCSVNRRKDEFIQAAFDFENQIEFKRFFPRADSLVIDDLLGYNCFNSNVKPTIIYRDDSIFEMFRLMKFNYRVCANTAAHSRRIGGGFTIFKASRKGYGAQEESVMSLFNGSLLTLQHYAIRNSLGIITRENVNNGSYIFEKGTLRRKILYSQNLYPRIPMKLLDDYLVESEGFRRFSDYLEYKFSVGSFKFIENHNFNISLYSIAGFDRRYWTSPIDYQKLKKDTVLQISKMLLHAKHKGFNAIIITIPGSGVFSNIIRNNKTEKDTRYLDSVEKGTEEAIKKYGRGFKEIVISGHRFSPKIEVN